MYFDATEFAARLSTLRKAQGMTQEEMAEALNISLEHLSKMERGANSHFLRTAGPHFPDNPGHIKRTALETSRTERRLRPANQY